VLYGHSLCWSTSLPRHRMHPPSLRGCCVARSCHRESSCHRSWSSPALLHGSVPEPASAVGFAATLDPDMRWCATASPAESGDLLLITVTGWHGLCGTTTSASVAHPATVRTPYPVSRIPYPVSRTVRVTEHFPAPLHGPSLQGIERRDLSIPGRGARYLRPQLPGTVRHGHSAIPAFLHMTAPTKGLSYGRRSLTRALRRSGPLIGCFGFSSRCPDGRLWQRAVSPDP
jgi:hypothetical protein